MKFEKTIGQISQDFNILLEVVPAPTFTKGATVAFDNIKLLNCFPEGDIINSCTPTQFRCSSTNLCINNSKVCDITHDCLYGDDENQNCGKLLYFFLHKISLNI